MLFWKTLFYLEKFQYVEIPNICVLEMDENF